MRIMLAALLTCLFGLSALAQDAKLAVCKDSPIPADRVVVSEYQSDGCSQPATNNAWDTVVPTDGTIICQKRSIESTAQVLELELCEKVISNSCPAQLDGTENAFVLRSPASCVAKKAPDIRLACIKDSQERLYGEFVVGIIETGDCGPGPYKQFAGNAYVIRKRVDPDSVLKMCWNPPFQDASSLESDDFFLRRFFSPYCEILKPDSSGPKKWNTVMVAKLKGRPSPGTMVCDTPVDPSYFLNGEGLRWGETKRVYTPLCGIDEKEKPNTIEVMASTNPSK
jgi:hypothetical protein